MFRVELKVAAIVYSKEFDIDISLPGFNHNRKLVAVLAKYNLVERVELSLVLS